MKIVVVSLLCIFSIGALAAVFEPATHAQEARKEQRYHYELAKLALEQADFEAFRNNYLQLGDYPLKVYLDYQLLTRGLDKTSSTDIDSFLREHTNTYLERRLRSQYLQELARTKRWADYRYFYRDDLASTSQRCHWLYARLKDHNQEISADEKLKQSQDYLNTSDEIAAIWSQPRSQPKQCDALFSLWKNSGALTSDIAWQRYVSAMDKGQRGLARYVTRYLPESYQRYIDAFQSLDARPHGILKTNNYTTHSPEMQQVIAFGIEKYARYHPDKALAVWQRYESKQIFPEQLSTRVKLYLTNRLIRKDFQGLATSLISSTPSLRREDVIERLIRNSLKEQHWEDVKFGIELLPENEQASDRWQYWLARAEDSLRGEEISESGKTIYRELSGHRSFYGFLSADRLGMEYSLRNQSSNIPQTTLDRVAAIPAIARARELWLIGYNNEAYAEWMLGLKELSARELTAAAALATNWGWHHRAIQATIAGRQWNQLNLRFPLAFSDSIYKAADETELQASFIFAIARQESAMAEDARSPVGAVGLMQLMPATARQTARKTGLDKLNKPLTDADYNISLGSRYLDELLERFSGNRILAAAAYNAGPHRVDRWMRDTAAQLPYDVWIETIPFNETRGYVQNVLAFSVIYSYRMGEQSTFITPIEALTPL